MVEYTYDGKTYTRPDKEPKASREMDGLHPVVRYPLEAYLARANALLTYVDIYPSETLRTVERQAWLFALGRDPALIAQGHRRARTWTFDSKHLVGLAADLVMVRKGTKEALWDETSWQWLYQTVPPESYGLRGLNPREWVHLEHLASDVLVQLGASYKPR